MVSKAEFLCACKIMSKCPHTTFIRIIGNHAALFLYQLKMISDLQDKSFKMHFKDFLFKELVGFLLGVIAMYEAATLIAHAKYIIPFA
jgi:hypothetical protein